MKLKFLGFLLLIGMTCQKQTFWESKKAYHGEVPPSNEPRIFMNDIINHLAHSAPTFTPDGKQIYWSVIGEGDTKRSIQMTEFVNGAWTQPKIAPFSGTYHDDQPFIAYDGGMIIFASKRPREKDGEDAIGLWVCKRMGNTLKKPVPIPGFWTPSLTESRNLYCMDLLENVEGARGIARANWLNGFQPLEFLPESINSKTAIDWTPFIARDESYLIFSSHRTGGYGMGDLYISFRSEDDTWSEPINMGPAINTSSQERFPGVSPDGKYLFFTRYLKPPHYHDLYWVKADIIEKLKGELK